MTDCMFTEKGQKNVKIHQKCTHTIIIVCERGNAGAQNNNFIKMRAFFKKSIASCVQYDIL